MAPLHGLQGKRQRDYYGIPFIRWYSQGLATNFRKTVFGWSGSWGPGESDRGAACFANPALQQFRYPIPSCAPVEGVPFFKLSEWAERAPRRWHARHPATPRLSCLGHAIGARLGPAWSCTGFPCHCSA